MKKYTKKKIQSFLIYLVLFYISGATVLASKFFIAPLTAVLIFINIKKLNKIIPQIVFIFIIWFLLNVSAINFLDSSFVFKRIFSVFITVLLFPYLVLDYIGNNFWTSFEEKIYFLTKLSLPIYSIYFVFPKLFDWVGHYFKLITLINYDSSYWSSMIYTHAPFGSMFYRNSGFMWEPGAFAMIILLGLSIYWLKNGAGINMHSVIYLVALITTQSTSGYLAVFVMIIGFNIKELKLKNIIIVIALLYILYFIFIRLPFLGAEIEYYINSFVNDAQSYNDAVGAIKVNRFSIVKYTFEKMLVYPYGYGVISEKDYKLGSSVVGVNGLTGIISMWGFFLGPIIIWRVYVFFSKMNIIKLPFKGVILIFFSFLMMMFSNPVERNILIYLIVYSSFSILKKCKVDSLVKGER